MQALQQHGGAVAAWLRSLALPWLCACAKLLLGSVGGAVGLPKIARFEYFVERGSLVAEFFSRCRVEESSESSRVSRDKVVIYLFISQKNNEITHPHDQEHGARGPVGTCTYM